MTIRVAHIGTGNVGRLALAELIENPAFELTGVGVSTPAKVGRDAGELAGLDPHTGIAATDAADMASESIATGRRPRKSTAVPATRVAISRGSVAAAATTEASVALPVRCSTSHGKATIEMPLAAAARNADDKISRAGPREVLTAGSIDS